MDDLHLVDTIGDEGSIKGGLRLNPVVRLFNVFKDGPEDEHVHIVIAFRGTAVGRGGGVIVMEDLTDIVVWLDTYEEMNEIGDGCSDPTVQASFSFLHISIMFVTQDSELHLKCNCPAFLVTHAGPWLAVFGAALTEKCIVQRLTDLIWIPAHPAIDPDQSFRVARVMHALRESVAKLQDWYDDVFEHQEPLYDISHPVRHCRLFPTPDTYIWDGYPVQFTYQEHLESYPSRATYLAKTVGADLSMLS
ncbi:hypothetical protein BDR03DRAFT_988154 [Suillus americanus]|nr:hypothetical protein BDR03DRAFT_988154 [Suillus americanus]